MFPLLPRTGLATLLVLLPAIASAAPAQPGPQLTQAPVHIGNAEWRKNFSMARAADGRAILAWSEDALLKLQRISATGEADGLVTQLNADTGQAITAIGSAMDNSGRYAVAYAKDDVFLRRFAADGTPQGTSWISAGSVAYGSVDNGISTPDCGSTAQLSWRNSAPQVAMNASGHTAMIWQRTGYCDGPGGSQAVDHRIYLREISAGGTGSQPRLIYRDELAYGHTSYVPADNFRITVASDNSVYFAWRREVPDYAPENLIRPLLLKHYVNGVAGASLTVQGDFKRLMNESGSDLHQVRGVDLAELSSGRLIIVWNSSESDPQYPWITLRRTDFRLLEPGSQTLGGSMSAEIGQDRLTGLAVDEQGGFTLSAIGTGSPVSVRHVRYSADGAQLSQWYPSGDIDFRNDIRVTYNFPRISNGNYLLLHVTGEIGGTGDALDNSRRELLIVPYGGPAGTRALYFKANKTQAAANGVFGDVILRWATNSEGSCQRYQNWSGSFTAPASSYQQLQFSTDGTRSYQLVCPGGLNRTVTIQVGDSTPPPPAPDVSLAASPETVSLGESSTLTWNSGHATTCNASGAWSGARGLSGNESTGPLETPGERTYTLVCTGAGGSTTTSVDIRVRGSTIPDAFAFEAVSDAEPGSQVTSQTVTISGLDEATGISISGGEYRIGDGAFTSAAGTVTPDAQVQVRATAPAVAGGTATATLTIGGISGGFSVTTRMPAQASTATIADAPGGSIMLTASAGTLSNARSVPTPAGAPANRSYPNGFVAFDITGVPVGGQVTVTLDLPAGSTPNSYLKCSADGSSCADFAGATFNGDRVTLVLTDNGAGDSNPAPGVISDPGAPSLRQRSGGGGGGAYGLWLLLTLAGLLTARQARARS